MKIKITFLILYLTISLLAQISNPIEIDGASRSSGQRAFQVVDGIVYLVSQQPRNYITFIKVIDENTQTSTIIDSITSYINYFTEPALQVLENGEIVVVYSDRVNTEECYLKIATSTDDGASFELETLPITSFGDPHIVKSDDGLDICYSEAYKTRSLAEFQHFTEYEQSENEDGGFAAGLVKFWGQDEFQGPVHSNDDIWIQQAGGGINNGWPTFHDMVTTAGRFWHFPTGGFLIDIAPMDDLFLGGYEEGVVPYTLHGVDEVRMYGLPLGGEDIDIVYVKLANGAFESMFGEIIQTGVDTFGVYSWFPHNAEEANTVVNNGGNWFEDADQIWTNHVTIYDTIWTNGATFPVTNQSVWVGDAELWIEGNVQGKQTWASADTIFIVGDITYHSTTPGTSPDDPDNTNLTDYFGLVSEKKILIRYKHKDPFEDMEIRNDNCVDVMLYGSYAALGIGDTLVYGDMACHYDGIFTPQYQHPHGSTPDFTALSPYTLQETLYTYIDLHKFIFPPDDILPPEISGFNLHGGNPINNTCGFPYESGVYINSYPNNTPNDYIYPYGTDYPWYNPVWPESSDDIVFERGQITMFGSLAQTRRGYIHRSGSDPYNHPDENEWDMDEYHYDGSHDPTGYYKEYHYDSRLKTTQPPHFPKVVQAHGDSRDIHVLHSIGVGQNFTETFIEEPDDILLGLWMDSDGEKVLVAYQLIHEAELLHFLISDDDSQSFEHFEVNIDDCILKNAHIFEDNVYVLCKSFDQDFIYRYQIGNPIPELIQSFDQVHNLSDFTVSESGVLAYVHETEGLSNTIDLDFRYNNGTGSMQGLTNWSWFFNDLYFPESEVSVKLDENNEAYATILTDYSYNAYSEGQLYLISSELDGLVEVIDEKIIQPKVSMQIFPNPFNPETTISFSLTTKNTENTEINIYNVKGQKVKNIPVILSGVEGSTGQYSVSWNGKDLNNKSVSTGIYLFELKTGGEVQKTKKGLLLK